MKHLALWICYSTLGSVPAWGQTPRPAMVVIAPHPDDAEASCGGLIANAAAAGQEVVVLSMTALARVRGYESDVAFAEGYMKARSSSGLGGRSGKTVKTLGGTTSERPAAKGLPEAADERVVFFGDSITERWAATVPAFFKGRPYLARGIAGQTTAQMRARFHRDVIALEPQAVVILAGTNDIAGNGGPYRQEDTFGNLVAMVELARAHHIRVVLASILPARDYDWRPGLTPAPKIIALNALLRAYAEKNGVVYLDYHGVMADEGGGLKAGLSADGVHPERAGYEVMGPLAERALQRALAAK